MHSGERSPPRLRGGPRPERRPVYFTTATRPNSQQPIHDRTAILITLLKIQPIGPIRNIVLLILTTDAPCECKCIEYHPGASIKFGVESRRPALRTGNSPRHIRRLCGVRGVRRAGQGYSARRRAECLSNSSVRRNDPVCLRAPHELNRSWPLRRWLVPSISDWSACMSSLEDGHLRAWPWAVARV